MYRDPILRAPDRDVPEVSRSKLASLYPQADLTASEALLTSTAISSGNAPLAAMLSESEIQSLRQREKEADRRNASSPATEGPTDV
jgi:hypothetical protein